MIRFAPFGFRFVPFRSVWLRLASVSFRFSPFGSVSLRFCSVSLPRALERFGLIDVQENFGSFWLLFFDFRSLSSSRTSLSPPHVRRNFLFRAPCAHRRFMHKTFISFDFPSSSNQCKASLISSLLLDNFGKCVLQKTSNTTSCVCVCGPLSSSSAVVRWRKK